MNILVVNDDGYEAPGIRALIESLEDFGEIYVVAPENERSASGHAITFADPIKVKPFSREGVVQGWSVVGTPADCVKVAVEKLLPVRPELVVSGINHGANSGTDIFYSGTVAAAAEAVMFGIPAVALSFTAHNREEDLTVAKQLIKYLFSFLKPQDILPGNLLNINIPAVSPRDIKGVAITTQGIKDYHNIFEERKDPRGLSYYWLGGREVELEQEECTDVSKLKNNYISITPIQLDLTAHENLKYYEKLLANNPYV